MVNALIKSLKTSTLLLLLLVWKPVSGFAPGEPSLDSLDLMIGQMIMIGIGDFNLVDSDEPIYEENKRGKVGGVVLYEKNILIESPKTELALLAANLQQNAEGPRFVLLDEEGGWVTRLQTR